MIFFHLLTDIICPLIVKRVLTGDVYTAYISTVSERRGHAKACLIPQTTTFKAVLDCPPHSKISWSVFIYKDNQIQNDDLMQVQ